MKNIIPKKISEYKTAVGIMTGTSLDGVDTLVTRVRGAGAGTSHENIAFRVYPIPARLKARMREIMHKRSAALEEICRINYEIAALYAACVRRISRAAGINVSDIDFMGVSGQTFYHVPGEATLQLGSGSFLSGLLGIPVVWDFRAADIAAGGQGAPLVPYLDFVLFAGMKKEIITLNIGGISNLTHIPASGKFEEITAFDCGPGNMIIDKMALEITGGRLRYDKNAKLALAGKISPKFFEVMRSHPYLKKSPPKSTGREEFGDDYACSLIDYCRKNTIGPNDMIRTAAEFTAFCIIESVKKFVIIKRTQSGSRGIKNPAAAAAYLVCAGGGAENPLLFDLLKKGLAPFGVETIKSRDMNVDSKSKEALLMAVLANETIYGGASNVPSATGAKRRIICGSVAYQK
ncbi:MAG: anhydro-N-acetylmuramic acid kinase [Candidatus Wallbacteria bacterium GWC2_49_35]|uniref:Anhydro-N-acetylmuramic acid kinase n=1 Tax=Candidatus Wallbacteria bacterium GWC2_49_35 TaxID=1817813 RepID=A0A1F7WUB0_9BACT|nr:MAG: anhydro-N-acetylmuramic acid kinase [Candidatus Wallbacteria bacterium GWC2_49_35]HBC76207.1 anhydro-N-acetylmuramic acid kinase [Candidatus Wallbacteria bacterium]